MHFTATGNNLGTISKTKHANLQKGDFFKEARQKNLNLLTQNLVMALLKMVSVQNIRVSTKGAIRLLVVKIVKMSAEQEFYKHFPKSPRT